MDLNDAIRGRRSIRSYTVEAVPMKLIYEVLEAATWAPSAKNGQQWRFTVLIGDSKKRLTDLFRSELQTLSAKIGKQQIGSSFSSCSIMEQAPVLIIVWNAGSARIQRAVRDVGMGISDDMRNRARAFGNKAELQSVAAAIQNLLLKAYSLGLGSLWIGDTYYAADALTAHLGKSWELVAAVAIGWPATPSAARPKMTVDEVTEFLN